MSEGCEDVESSCKCLIVIIPGGVSQDTCNKTCTTPPLPFAVTLRFRTFRRDVISADENMPRLKRYSKHDKSDSDENSFLLPFRSTNSANCETVLQWYFRKYCLSSRTFLCKKQRENLDNLKINTTSQSTFSCRRKQSCLTNNN